MSEKKYIFIDTNLYRNLFISAEYAEKIFPILEKLTKNGYIVLMPQQVIDEINRNRFLDWSLGNNRNKISKLEKAIVELNKDPYSEFSYNEKLLSQINKKIGSLKKEDEVLQKQLVSQKGSSARLIKKLSDMSIVVADSEEILKATQLRSIKGNPPFDSNVDGKSCDRYIWESLLFYFRDNKIKRPILFLFTRNTRDWCGDNGGVTQFLNFLLCEFKGQTGGSIIWSENLRDLPSISNSDKRIVIEEDQKVKKIDIILKIEKTLPERLLFSNSWNNTDQIINQVMDYIPDFDPFLISKILEVSLQNNNISVGPYNQVLDASQSKRFFMALYEHAKLNKYSMAEWKEFYLQLNEGQQEKFYEMRKDMENNGEEFDFQRLKYINIDDIPF